MTRKPITAHADHAAIKAMRDLRAANKIVPAVPASQSEAWPSHPYEARCPFDYNSASVDELAPFLGRKWTVCRATSANRERYIRCITPKQYRDAEAKAIEARGYARPAERMIRDLIALWERTAIAYIGAAGAEYLGRNIGDGVPEIEAARTVLTKARVP